jgi:hypothetical protein
MESDEISAAVFGASAAVVLAAPSAPVGSASPDCGEADTSSPANPSSNATISTKARVMGVPLIEFIDSFFFVKVEPQIDADSAVLEDALIGETLTEADIKYVHRPVR